MADVRKIAFNTIYRVLFDEAYSALSLSSAIKENNLNPLDASFLSHLVYGVIERKILLDHIVRSIQKSSRRRLKTKPCLF